MRPWPGLFALALLAACDRSPPPQPGPSLGDRLGGADTAGYALATAPRPLHFPADHGAHPAFRNEWWYFTGNLASTDGRRFGYQVTLFRIALRPAPAARASAWGTRDVWMGHLALSDATTARHFAAERFARGAAGLAGVQTEPRLEIWLEDWQISRTDERWQITAATPQFALDLELRERRPPVLQGEAGLSRKSTAPGNASYYYSIPRLATQGRLRIAGAEHQVTGQSWLDREWSTSALAPDQTGWDWFALQFADGRDLMYYRLRRSDGSADPLSAGSLTREDGSTERLDAHRLALAPRRWWQADDGTRYPVAWELTLDGRERLRVEAVFDDQRMDLSVRYWEGMVTVHDAVTDQLLGRGYLELAGY